MTGLAALVLVLVLGFVLSAFYSGSETGLYTVNRFRLRRRAHRGERSARLLERLLSDPVGLLATFLVANNVANYALSAAVTGGFEALGFTAGGSWWRRSDVLATLTLVAPLFLFGEMLPKNYFRKHTERLSYLAAWGLAATKVLLYPLIYPFRALTALLPAGQGAGAALGLPRLSRHMIEHVLSHGLETGELTSEQERLARNVLRSGERRVAQLARPVGAASAPSAASAAGGRQTTAPVLAIPADARAGQVLQRLIEARTKLAVVMTTVASEPKAEGAQPLPAAQGAPPTVICRDVMGYVRLFDLLAPGVQGRPVSALVRPVPRLAAHATLRSALNTMQRECADLAIVESPPPRRAGKQPPRLPEPGTGHGEPGCPLLGVVHLPEVIGELLSRPPDGQQPGAAKSA